MTYKNLSALTIGGYKREGIFDKRRYLCYAENLVRLDCAINKTERGKS